MDWKTSTRKLDGLDLLALLGRFSLPMLLGGHFSLPMLRDHMPSASAAGDAAAAAGFLNPHD